MPSTGRSGYNDGQLSFEALWAEPELARDEQVRAHGDPPLADVSARQAARDPGERPDTVLHGAGGAGGVRDRGAADAAGGTGPEGGGVPREGRAAQRGADAGRGEGAARADPASPGGRRGGRLAAAGGPPVVRQVAGDHGGRRRVAFSPAAGEQLAPSGERARVDVNLAALRLRHELEQQDRALTVEQQRTLAAWAGWGAVPGVFDEDRDEWAQARSELLELAGEDGYAAARRTTINAHYTDPAIVAVIWQTVGELGFDGGRVLEPGCGIGTFIGLAPADAELTGVELDPATARLAQALYPHASVRNESFADTRLPDGHFDLTVGNVPFADVRLHEYADPVVKPTLARSRCSSEFRSRGCRHISEVLEESQERVWGPIAAGFGGERLG